MFYEETPTTSNVAQLLTIDPNNVNRSCRGSLMLSLPFITTSTHHGNTSSNTFVNNTQIGDQHHIKLTPDGDMESEWANYD
jgi:hypothetical protein